MPECGGVFAGHGHDGFGAAVAEEVCLIDRQPSMLEIIIQMPRGSHYRSLAAHGNFGTVCVNIFP